ncbi:MAG: chemotaxis protein CheY [Chthoniobacteraceae bacterium]|nr:chemotaxis protein CheY [Chthoniobacteraceae bacterium]
MKHILLVEDDPAILRVLKDNFVTRGFRVSTASEGGAGLDLAINSAPDLIVLDLMLPNINGYEICRTVRAENLATPILMLSAKGQEDDIIRGLELGADDYLTKPFGIRELIARSQALLRRSQAGTAPSYEFGCFRLDTVGHRLFKNSVEVPLTGKEFRLLEYFLQASGRALTRQIIMNAVWGSSVLVTARSVDRCVTTLRSKIEPDLSDPIFIQTIREIGYRFETGEQKSAAPH